jgi:beta-glucosidase
MAMGEAPDMTGEAKSKANIHLPGMQEELIKAVVATGKPVVVILLAGRPMVFNWTAEHVPAILYAWWPGSQGGHAMADVLLGKYNPSAKLPVSFPRTEGQIPIYYNHYNTGRPATGDSDRFYRSAYTDLSIYPQYAFGHGLSYTTFVYSHLQWKRNGDKILVTFDLTNTGKLAGEEVAQLYLHNLLARPLRPVMELQGFRKIMLQPGETRSVSMELSRESIRSYNEQQQKVCLPIDCQIRVGGASDSIALQSEIIHHIFQ